MKPQIVLARLMFLLWALLFLTLPASAREIPAIVSTNWLEKNLANPRLVVLDIRKVEAYREGHIPGAVNAFYSAWAFQKDNTFKSHEELEKLVTLMIGSDRNREIVTYCDAGKCCPTWSFLLREVLGYRSVRIYDGSMQEWTEDTSHPVDRSPGSP
jgi:thiosulfate/3-mercaptopyruvate sulfurtransferase